MLELFLTIAVIVVLIGFFITLLIAFGTISIILFKVPFVPTPKENINKIFELFDLKKGQKFYDLGCGEGRFLIEATNQGARAIGFEISVWAYLRGQLNLLIHKNPAKIFFKNFLNHDLSDADAVYCFLIKKVMPQVAEKLKAELKPGAKIISYGFELPGWTADQIIQPNKKLSHIYFYVKK
ncbi:MAG: class I SAM-dependent methyltransferase [Candidatus Buchananbacteria bacterium]|nr:class I SAM-dependent methyltransferase [Candidatus Buchananbacteria bacterium]